MNTGVTERGRMRRHPWIAPPALMRALMLATIGASVAVVGAPLMLGAGRVRDG